MISAAHKSHNFAIVDEFKDKLKQEVIIIVKKCHDQDKIIDQGLLEIENFRSQIKQDKEQSVRAIKACFKEIHQTLKQKESELIAEVVENARISFTNKDVTNAQNRSQNLKRLLNYVDELMQKNEGGSIENVETLCSLKKQLTEWLNTIKIEKNQRNGFHFGHQQNDPRVNYPNNAFYESQRVNQSLAFMKTKMTLEKNVANVRVKLVNECIKTNQNVTQSYKNGIDRIFKY